MKNINRLMCCSSFLFLLCALLGSTAIGQTTDADCAKQAHSLVEQLQEEEQKCRKEYDKYCEMLGRCPLLSECFDTYSRLINETADRCFQIYLLWIKADDGKITCAELDKMIKENPQLKLPSVDKPQSNFPKQQDIKKSVKEPENQLQIQQAIRDLTKDLNEIFEHIEGKTNKDKKTDQVRKTLEKPTYDVYESPDLQREGFDMDEEEAMSLWNQAAGESELESLKTSQEEKKDAGFDEDDKDLADWDEQGAVGESEKAEKSSMTRTQMEECAASILKKKGLTDQKKPEITFSPQPRKDTYGNDICGTYIPPSEIHGPKIILFPSGYTSRGALESSLRHELMHFSIQQDGPPKDLQKLWNNLEEEIPEKFDVYPEEFRDWALNSLLIDGKQIIEELYISREIIKITPGLSDPKNAVKTANDGLKIYQGEYEQFFRNSHTVISTQWGTAIIRPK